MRPPHPRLCATLALTLAAALPATARATAGPPAGHECEIRSLSVEDGEWTGEYGGGPVAAPGSTVELRCSIHVGNTVHSGPAQVVLTSGPAQNAAAVPPTPVTYYADDADLLAFCTEATVDGTTWYWTDSGWTTDADSGCITPRTIVIPPCFVRRCTYDLLDTVFETFGEVADPVVCTALGGDVYVHGERWWDCPPYGA